MARLPPLVIPDYPHHVTQRGNRRAQIFFKDDDYALYESLLSEAARKTGAEVWTYFLMLIMKLIAKVVSGKLLPPLWGVSPLDFQSMEPPYPSIQPENRLKLGLHLIHQTFTTSSLACIIHKSS